MGGLSELYCRRALTCGSAACLAERLCLSDAWAPKTTPSTRAGRLSLPARLEEEQRRDLEAVGAPLVGAQLSAMPTGWAGTRPAL